MCGISGIISLNKRPIDDLEPRIKLMTKMLHHRGPDQNGIYISKKKLCAISNNRLSIVSPKEKIDLPFTKNKNTYLSFNGEIYNYLDLKKNLQDRGIKFITNTDTEVFYEYLCRHDFKNYWKLNGMWSFAFYDEEKHECLLSRDTMGERHLYYTVQDGELIFSSEVKPILTVLKKKQEIDFDSLIASWKFYACEPGKTLIKNINRLKAGESITFSDGEVKTKNFEILHPEKWFDYFNSNPSLDAVTLKLNEMLIDEMRIRVPNDVSYYTTLSGGIDSTLTNVILSETQKIRPNSIFGISGDYQHVKDRSGMSELESSHYVAKKLNINHKEINLFDNAANIMNDFAEDSFDGCIEPCTANFAGMAHYIQKQNSKVIFVSDGPDEMMNSYNSEIEAYKMDKVYSILRYLPNYESLIKNNFIQKALIKFLSLEKLKNFEFKYKPFYHTPKHDVCANSFFDKIIENYDNEKLFDYGLVDTKYNEILKYLDFNQIRSLNYAASSLPDTYNLRVDKAFMKYSVEARLPYQSIKIIEFLIAMPVKFKIKNNEGKYLLRKHLEKKISKLIATRPKTPMGGYLWEDSKVMKKLNINEKIESSNFFENFPFKKNIKNTLLNKETHQANRWSAMCFINTFDKLKKF